MKREDVRKGMLCWDKINLCYVRVAWIFERDIQVELYEGGNAGSSWHGRPSSFRKLTKREAGR